MAKFQVENSYEEEYNVRKNNRSKKKKKLRKMRRQSRLNNEK